MDSIHIQIRGLILAAGVTQEQVAKSMGMDQTIFSRIMHGHRATPSDFKSRVRRALDRLQAAETAAQDARDKVMHETETWDGFRETAKEGKA